MARKGLPKSIIKKYGISKKAWAVFRGQKSKGSTPRPKKARKVKKVARRRYSRKRSRRSGGMTVPLAVVGGLGAGLARPIKTYIDTGDLQLAAWQLVEGYTGYYVGEGNWDMKRLQYGLVPLVAGALVHKFVGGSPLNVNRILAAAKVPFIRI